VKLTKHLTANTSGDGLKYYFDTYALVEIIKDNAGYHQYAEEDIVTSNLNLGELYQALLKDFGDRTAQKWLAIFRDFSLSVELDTIIKAVKFRLKNKEKSLSFVDCISYVYAKELGLVFLTGDKEFEGMENVEFVK
jgi:uncharacterized protein